jgi:hypothetical protein
MGKVSPAAILFKYVASVLSDQIRNLAKSNSIMRHSIICGSLIGLAEFHMGLSCIMQFHMSNEYHWKQEKVNTMLGKLKSQINGFEMIFLSLSKKKKI